MKHVAFGERNKNEGGRDRWRERRGEKEQGMREGGKERERERERDEPS